MKSVHPIVILPIMCLLLCLPLYAGAQNHVLSLDGDATTASIGGTVMMLDDKTPHVACVVQAVTYSTKGEEPSLVATTLSGEEGKY